MNKYFKMNNIDMFFQAYGGWTRETCSPDRLWICDYKTYGAKTSDR